MSLGDPPLVPPPAAPDRPGPDPDAPPPLLGSRWQPGITTGAVILTLVLAGAVVLLADAAIEAVIRTLNDRSDARVGVVVTTGAIVVVRTDAGDGRAYLVPAQTQVILPPGDHGTIDVLDDACRRIGSVGHDPTVAWQLVVVEPQAVRVEYPAGTPPPLPEAAATDACP